MGTIFISHSSGDRAMADVLADALKEHDYHSVFSSSLPGNGIRPGRDWEQELYRELRRADAVAFLGTDASVDSKWCFAELAIAKSLGKPIFPIGINIDTHPLLDAKQWIKVATEGAPPFDQLWPELESVVDPLATISWRGESPYPGLAAFDADRAGVFFGREAEIRQVGDRLRSMRVDAGALRVLAVFGASGSGKSSLVRAGVAPRLAASREWVIVAPFTPDEGGALPLEAMSRKLARALGDADDWRSVQRRIEADPRELASIARDLLDRGDASARQVLLVVDQAEELLRNEAADREAFLGPLVETLRADNPLALALTMRSDFAAAALSDPLLAALLQAPVMLAPLDRANLRLTVDKPALEAGARFAPGLTDMILDDVTGSDALPLLAFALELLFGERDATGEISTESYLGIGRFEGALQQHADEVFESLERRGLAAEVLPTLVKFADVGDAELDRPEAVGVLEPMRRRVNRDRLTESEGQVIEAFVQARLLTTMSENLGDPRHPESGVSRRVVEVTHEALLRTWLPLRDAIRESSSELRLRAGIERAASSWDRGGRDAAYLVHRNRPAQLRSMAVDQGAGERSIVEDYVHACLAAHDHAVADADRQRREREARVLAAQALASLEPKPQLALLLAAEAAARVRAPGESSLPEVDDALATVVTEFRALPLRAVGDELTSLELSLDGSHAARLDGEVLRVWMLGEDGSVAETASDPMPALGPYARVRWAGRRVLVLGDSDSGQVVRVFEPHDPGSLTEIGRYAGQLIGVSPSGTVLVVRNQEGSSVLVAVGRSLDELGRLPRHLCSTDVAFDDDGGRFVLCDEQGGVVYRLDSQGAALTPRFECRVDAGSTCRFSPDGRWLFAANTSPDSGGSFAHSTIWNVTDVANPTSWSSFGGRNVAFAEFSPDSRWLAFVGWNDMYQDEYVRLYRLDPSAGVPQEHRLRLFDEINTLAFSVDGRWLIAASLRDDNALVWDLRVLWGVDPECGARAVTPIPLGGHGRGVQRLSLLGDGSTIVTLSRDGILRQFELERQASKRGGMDIWRVSPSSPTILHGHDGPIASWTASGDGRTLITAAEADHPRLWRLPASEKAAPANLLAEARRLADRDLTDAERAQIALAIG